MADSPTKVLLFAHQDVHPQACLADVLGPPTVPLAWPRTPLGQATLSHHPQVGREPHIRDVGHPAVVDREGVHPRGVRDLPERRPPATTRGGEPGITRIGLQIEGKEAKCQQVPVRNWPSGQSRRVAAPNPRAGIAD